MTQGTLSLNVRRVGDTVAVLDIEGEITAFSEEALMEAYTAGASEDGTRAVILNFTGLEYMNSGGIGLLVTLLVRTQRSGQRLLAVGLSEHYRQILALTRLDEAIAIHDDESTALAAASA
jgi:anti-sigma B factor antagonist